MTSDVKDWSEGEENDNSSQAEPYHTQGNLAVPQYLLMSPCMTLTQLAANSVARFQPPKCKADCQTSPPTVNLTRILLESSEESGIHLSRETTPNGRLLRNC